MDYLVPPIPPDEAERLAALRAFGLLDTPREPVFDDLVTAAAALMDVPIALVSLVDAERQWFKACVGLAGEETSRDVSFCAHAIAVPSPTGPFVVLDATVDPRFRGNPNVVGDPFVRFYAGAPILTPRGHAIGTLCTIDRVPKQPSDRQLDALMALARQTMVAISERQVLDTTLRAACRTLLESLALANPVAFSRATRVRAITALLASTAGLGDRWELDVAAMLTDLGAVTLPVDTLERLEAGAELDESDHELLHRLPHLANDMLANLPRLELVRAVIMTASGHGGIPERMHPFISVASELLRAAQRVDEAESRGTPRPAAVASVRDEHGPWKPEVGAALDALEAEGARAAAAVQITFRKLQLGQVLAADVRSSREVVLVGRGQTVTQPLLDRLSAFGDVREPLWIHPA